MMLSSRMQKINFILIQFILITYFSFGQEEKMTDNQLQAKLNIINGASSECVMHYFYTKSGWNQVEGEVGRNGIDGLYYKKKNGAIKEVLVSESKWNTARLGKSGKNKLVKQMSQEWVLRTLGRLQKYKPIPEYQIILKLVQNDQYRARLFKLLPIDDNKIQIIIYKVKNKGLKNFDLFIESTLRPITISEPENSFEKGIIVDYNECRAKALVKYIPVLNKESIELLLHDNYLQPYDLRKVFKKSHL